MAQSKAVGDLHFLLSAPAKIERFELSSRTWLPSVSLPAVRGTPTAATVDADGIYVAYDKSCYRYDLSGGQEKFLLNSDYPVISLHTDGNLLLLNRSDGLYARFTSVNKTTNAVISTMENYVDSVFGSSIAPAMNRLFGRSLGVSPSDITYVNYNDDGTFNGGGDSPAHGDYPSGTKTWVFPSGSRVVDDSGTVYSTSNLVYSASLGGSFNDLTFNVTDLPVVLRGKEVMAYNAAMLPVGSASLADSPTRIFVSGSDVLAFKRNTADPHGVSMETLPLAALSAPQPGSGVDPRGLPYTPDAVWVGNDGKLLLFSKSLQSVFRWDPATQDYAGTIPLLGSPDYATYSKANNRIYLAYTNGAINRIELDGADHKEVAFAILPAAPRGLAAAGSYLMAGDASGAWMTHRTFDASGTQISAKDWNYYSREYVWSESNQKLYFFRDDTSPNDLIWESIGSDGALGQEMDSPYHGDFAISHPIRVSPDGSRVMIGSGVAFDATTLVKQTSGLSNSFTDGDWSGTTFWSLRDVAGMAQLQEWTGSTFAPGRVKQWQGTTRSLMTLADGRLMAITAGASKIPSFHILDTGSLAVIPPATLAAPSAPTPVTVSTTSLTIQWNDITGEAGYEVERQVGASGAWILLGTTGMSESTFQDSTVSAGQNYAYRVTAVNAALRSAASTPLNITTGPPAAPVGVAATQVGASGGSSATVQITWSPVPMATSYEIQSRAGSNTTWDSVGTAQAADKQYNFYYAYAGTRYDFRVRAVNALGSGAWSGTATFCLAAPVPATPSWQNSTVTGTSITLRWTTVSYASEYRIESRVKGTADWSSVSATAITAGQFTQSGLKPETSYEYRIRSHSEDGDSAWSSTQTLVTLGLPPLATPSLLTVSGATSGSLVIIWSNVTDETGYSLERQVDSGWTEILRPSADVTTFTDTGLKDGVMYSYRMRAFNKAYSTYSNTLSASPGLVTVVASDDFDTIALPPWSGWSGAEVIKGKPGLKTGAALWFGLNGARYAETLPLPLGRNSSVQFSFRAGNEAVDGAEYWNNSESGETVTLESSLDGFTWAALTALDTTAAASRTWQTLSVTLPEAAASQSTRLRWRQLSHTGPSYDTWAIDDVSIKSTAPELPGSPAFLLGSPTTDDSFATATLYWQETTGALLYDVERSSGSGAWAAVATLPAADTFWVDPATVPGSLYAYRVRARNSAGSSSWSPSALVQVMGTMQAWRAAYLGSSQPTEATGDFDLDAGGVPYILRFASKMAPGNTRRILDPANPSAGGMPSVIFDKTLNCLTVTFLRPRAESSPDIQCIAEFSSDGMHWTPVNAADQTTPLDTVWESVECHDPVSASQAPVRFARVRITRGAN